MRNELELISTIEKYLNNELSAEERTAFEKNMSGSPQLQEAVALQKEIMKGIENLSLKQNIQQAKNRYFRNRSLIRWGLSGGIVIVTIISILIYSAGNNSHSKTSPSSASPEFNELNEKIWADADRRIEPQQFSITGGRDTIIETKSGMVIQIPANGFLTANKQPVTGKIELIVKEATDATTIIRAGLSSTSGNQLLESAGMFYLNARQNENLLVINPTSALHIEMPCDTIQPGMKLFKGKRLANGTIDWVDPQPLAPDVTPVDINNLNFYPPRYLDSLARWGYNIRDKKFTDSLYYSFSDWFNPPPPSEQDYVDSAGRNYLHFSGVQCAVNPAKIQTIWNEKFQNTLLATREFEERLHIIHELEYERLHGDAPGNDILDLYINNMDKQLFEIDSMAAQKLEAKNKKTFLAFAARHDGRVKLNSAQTQKLRQYYNAKTQAFMDAVAKTNAAYWEKQAQFDKVAADKKVEHTADSLRGFEEELKANLKSAYNQLGYDTSGTPRLPISNVYRADITATGWYNVDRYVYEATSTRTSMNFTDLVTGKTATIKYKPASFQLNKPEQYDDLYVYLLPDTLNSYIRVSQTNGKFEEQLNQLLKYKLLCIAYKGDRTFFYSQPAVEPKAYTNIELTEIAASELDRILVQQGNRRQAGSLQKVQAYYRFSYNDAKRQKRNQDLRQLKQKISFVIFKCLPKLWDKYSGEESAY